MSRRISGRTVLSAVAAILVQALVAGYRIKVRAGERVLDYHASENRRFVLCPEGRATEPTATK